MNPDQLQDEIQRRRVLAIISHPDAGKTTITEKLILLGRLIQVAGTVKGKKADRHATSDWMEMEKQRGISVTSSVMQFPYSDSIVNLLDTPGHEDFSEDTYRVLTAVDSALMVVDGAKGVEARTIKLMEVCRLRDTPIFTFVNKLDRDIRDAIDVLDEIETILKIKCAPINWPLGMGKQFKGVYSFLTDTIHVYQQGLGDKLSETKVIRGIRGSEAKALLGGYVDDFIDEIELVQGASHDFELDAYLKGELTPVYFGTALGNFGIREMLDDFVKWAPAPQDRITDMREVKATESAFSGFVFKIQANMDPKHRDRIAFMRICSGEYSKGMKMHHARLKKDIKVADAVTFFAGDREQALSEEGSTQLFMPLRNNDLIVGAIGVLQFDVVAYRLKDEYKVDAIYEPVTLYSARWVDSQDEKNLDDFRKKTVDNLALDSGGYLTYLAPTRVNLNLVEERWPDIRFSSTREH